MNAIEFLNSIIDQPLCYGIKSPDMDLYDFGFGNVVSVVRLYKKKEMCTLTLHVTCRFKVIWKKNESRIEKYDEDTPNEKFNSEVRRLVGLKVKRVALSEKNDLWIDFGDCWVVFATFENEEESWRFFTADENVPHLVASNSWIHFE